jgi:hypothetical protein
MPYGPKSGVASPALYTAVIAVALWQRRWLSGDSGGSLATAVAL